MRVPADPHSVKGYATQISATIERWAESGRDFSLEFECAHLPVCRGESRLARAGWNVLEELSAVAIAVAGWLEGALLGLRGNSEL